MGRFASSSYAAQVCGHVLIVPSLPQTPDAEYISPTYTRLKIFIPKLDRWAVGLSCWTNPVQNYAMTCADETCMSSAEGYLLPLK